MVEQLLADFEHQVESVRLTPSRGGIFKVTVNGHFVYLKKVTSRHAEYDDVSSPVGALLPINRPARRSYKPPPPSGDLTPARQ